jgi:hypothetical protein
MRKFFLVVTALILPSVSLAEINKHQESRVLMTADFIRTVLIPSEYAKIIDDFVADKLTVKLSEQTSMVARYERVDVLGAHFFAASVVWKYTVTYDGVAQSCPGDTENARKGQCEVEQGVHFLKPDKKLPPLRRQKPNETEKLKT